MSSNFALPLQHNFFIKYPNISNSVLITTWGTGFRTRRSTWPSRQKRGYRNAWTFFLFIYKIWKNDQQNMSVHVKCRYAYFFFRKFLCQNYIFFYNRRKPYVLKVRNQLIFNNQLWFSYKFVRNSLKFIQQTQKAREL